MKRASKLSSFQAFELFVCLALGGCEKAQQPSPPEITVTPTATATASATASASATAIATATASATASASVTASAAEPPPFGAAWLSCRRDAECVVVALGCCHGRAVNKAHEADGQRVLNESGLAPCPVKAACYAPVACVHAICKLTNAP